MHIIFSEVLSQGRLGFQNTLDTWFPPYAAVPREIPCILWLQRRPRLAPRARSRLHWHASIYCVLPLSAAGEYSSELAASNRPDASPHFRSSIHLLSTLSRFKVLTGYSFKLCYVEPIGWLHCDSINTARNDESFELVPRFLYSHPHHYAALCYTKGSERQSACVQTIRYYPLLTSLPPPM
jgi:hypothetical protein